MWKNVGQNHLFLLSRQKNWKKNFRWLKKSTKKLKTSEKKTNVPTKKIYSKLRKFTGIKKNFHNMQKIHINWIHSTCWSVLKTKNWRVGYIYWCDQSLETLSINRWKSFNQSIDVSISAWNFQSFQSVSIVQSFEFGWSAKA